MSPDELRQLLDRVREGQTPLDDAHQTLLAALRAEPLADLGFARVDHHRPSRQGFPEVVLGLGKTPDQIASIAVTIAKRGHPLLVTRADDSAATMAIAGAAASAGRVGVGRAGSATGVPDGVVDVGVAAVAIGATSIGRDGGTTAPD